MSLSAGSRLGPYEILAPLGAGGMGEVYRARDTRLGRDVAIKVLNSNLIANADLKARFEREARTISQLNHPNICVLHDVGHDGDTDFLVMEYLEGESLADRLKKGAVPLDQLVKIGCEIADALDRAHRAGIVHRDLKPGNVMLTKSGAKLLDFGLAKPAAMGGTAASGSAPLLSAAMTMTSPSPQHSPLTQQGSLVGTVQYMSPEQIQGIEADARSDIFAFGALLYEMATGKRAFEGKSQIKVASAILEDEPPAMSQAQPSAPAELNRLTSTCLQKDPERRFQCARDLKLELTWLLDGAAVEKKPSERELTFMTGTRTATIFAIVMTLLAVAATAALWFRRTAPMSLETYILPPDKTNFTLSLDDAAGPVMLSPDGKKIAFIAIGEQGVDRIYVRSLDDKDAKPIPGTENATYPFWSPDGQSLAFFSSGKLRRVALGGGPVIDICGAERFRGGTWGPQGIVFASDVTSGLSRVDANAGATAAPVTTLTADQTTHRWPQMLSDGRHFLYVAANHSDPTNSRNGIYFASLDGKENHVVVAAESNGVYADGRLLWEQGGSLLAQPFDPSSGKLSGETVAIAGSVGYNASTWRAAFDASENGMLIYQPGLGSDSGQLLLFGTDGKPVAVPDSGGFVDVRISPDGRKAAALTTKKGHDILLLDLEQGTRVRFTFAVTTDGFAWSADGKYLYYATAMKPNKIIRKALDGSQPEITVFESQLPVHVSDVSPDGRYLLIAQQYGKIPTTTFLLPLDAGAKPKPISEDQSSAFTAVFSPDSKWILYTTTETGRPELYLTPVNGGAKQQLTSTRAELGRWSADGKTIYFANPDGSTFALPVTVQGNTVQAGKPRLLFAAGGLVPMTFHSRSWDVTPDGHRFLTNVTGERSDQSRAILVTNWPARLKK